MEARARLLFWCRIYGRRSRFKPEVSALKREARARGRRAFAEFPQKTDNEVTAAFLFLSLFFLGFFSVFASPRSHARVRLLCVSSTLFHYSFLSISLFSACLNETSW
jgi:hypothetical protein